ncbi:MAG: beta-ketoacyl-ACP synthase III [Candidatus Sumerlaeia bacterium]
MVDKQSIGFLGLGAYAPERVLTNHDLEKMVDTSHDWIVTRTGIVERRICAPGQGTVAIATESARRALEDAGLTADDIDLIICCTFTSETLCPSAACQVQRDLGVTRPIPAFDLVAACSGFIYGCSVAASFVRSGVYRRVLVIGVDAVSKFIDWTDRNTCVLFADGGGAAVIGPVEKGRGLLGQSLGADGTGADAIKLMSSGVSDPFNLTALNGHRHTISMNGHDVFKFATRILGTAVEEALANAGGGLKAADLDLIIPHQANVRIIESAAKKLKLPMDRFVINIDKFGNTSAGTVPLAMQDARREGRLKPGTLFAVVAFGGGLTYAASIWRW